MPLAEKMRENLAAAAPTGARRGVAVRRATRAPRTDGAAKSRVLRAAAHLFLTQGYERTTVRDLAEAVGIQSGSLFHHFASKEEILEQVMVEVVERNTLRMRAALGAEKAPRERLRALIYAELSSIHGETGAAMTLLFVEWRSLAVPARKRILALRHRYDKLWLDAIVGAKTEVVALDPFELRRLLGGAIAYTSTWYRPRGPISLDHLAADILLLALKKKGAGP